MLDALPSLIIATAELSVVRAITSAINANLPKTGPLGTIPPSANPHTPRPHPKFDDNPRAQPGTGRVHMTPGPRFDPRVTIHPNPRIEVVSPPSVINPDTQASVSTEQHNPIQPPWKVLPWPQEDRIIVEPKVYSQTVDLIHKGTLLDLFV